MSLLITNIDVMAVNASPLISKKELAEYWMSCIMDCAKTILTKKDEDLVEDRLQECFQEASSIDFDVVVSRDKLAAEALELFGIALFSEDGRDAFLSLAMELRTFFSILGLFIEFSSSSKLICVRLTMLSMYCLEQPSIKDCNNYIYFFQLILISST